MMQSIKSKTTQAFFTRKEGRDNIDRQMSLMEFRMNRAQQHREELMQKKLDDRTNQPEVSLLIQNKKEREQKFMEDIFAKITMKRAEKDKKLKEIEKK